MPVLESEPTDRIRTSHPRVQEQKTPNEATQFRRFCQEHHRLMTAFAEAVDQLLLLHQSRFAAVVSGQPMLERIDSLIEQAKQKKERAKLAYLKHAQRHN